MCFCFFFSFAIWRGFVKFAACFQSFINFVCQTKLARAAAQLRRLLRLADVAQHDVAVAASSVGGDGLPLVSLGPAAPAGVVGVGRKNSLDGNGT